MATPLDIFCRHNMWKILNSWRVIARRKVNFIFCANELRYSPHCEMRVCFFTSRHAYLHCLVLSLWRCILLGMSKEPISEVFLRKNITKQRANHLLNKRVPRELVIHHQSFNSWISSSIAHQLLEVIEWRNGCPSIIDKTEPAMPCAKQIPRFLLLKNKTISQYLKYFYSHVQKI